MDPCARLGPGAGLGPIIWAHGPILPSVVAYWPVKSQLPKSVNSLSQIKSKQIKSNQIRSNQFTLKTDLANHLLPEEKAMLESRKTNIDFSFKHKLKSLETTGESS